MTWRHDYALLLGIDVGQIDYACDALNAGNPTPAHRLGLTAPDQPATVTTAATLARHALAAARRDATRVD